MVTIKLVEFNITAFDLARKLNLTVTTSELNSPLKYLH